MNPLHTASEAVEPTGDKAAPSVPPELAIASGPGTAWPLHQPANIGFWLLLAATLYLPVAFAWRLDVVNVVAVTPVLLGALAAQVVFEGLAGTHPARIRTLRTVAAGAGAVAGLAIVVSSSLVLGLALTPVGIVAGAGGAFLCLWTAAAVRSFELKAGAAARRVFFVGSQSQAADLAREIDTRGGMRLVGMRVAEAGSDSDNGLIREISSSRVTTLVMSAEAIRDERLVAVASRLHLRGLRVRGLNDFYEEQFNKVPLSELSQAWFLFDVAEIHRARLYGAGKRALETTVAAFVLVVSAPLLPLIALAVRLSGPGPVLFRQERVGRDGERFTLTKFRTMGAPPAKEPPGWGNEHSHRITGVGRVLRRWRLDELPQLVHVIHGDLSLVGPRPEQPEIVERLAQSMEFYPARHCVRPGLTGWAQVNYGYGGSATGAVEKLQYDFFYIKRQSLKLDLLIIASTLRAVVTGRGV